MAHCVIILQPRWILIKKNSKREGEKKASLRQKWIRNRPMHFIFRTHGSQTENM